MQSISKSKSIHKNIIVGDFNLSKTSWPDGSSQCKIEKGFTDMFNDLGLEQLISEPTHIAGNTLDLLLCNQPNIISDIEVMPRGSICSSPHYSIKFKVKLKYKRLKASKRKVYNFKKANFKLLNDELMRFPWDSILIGDDVDSMLNKFEVAFFSICDRHIPKVTIKSSFQPPWFDSELDRICKKKDKLLTKFRRETDPFIKEQLNEEIKKVCNTSRKASTTKKERQCAK